MAAAADVRRRILIPARKSPPIDVGGWDTPKDTRVRRLFEKLEERYGLGIVPLMSASVSGGPRV